MSEQPAHQPNARLATVVAHVVTYNHAATIENCISALKTQVGFELGENLFIQITDNASSDNTLDCLRKQIQEGIEVIHEAENIGFTGAHNRGYRYLLEHEAKYLLLVNPDLAMQEKCLQNLVQALEFDSSAGACCPKLLRADENLSPVRPAKIDAVGMKFSRSCRHFDYGAAEIDQGQFESESYVFGGSGACLLISKDCIADVGFPSNDDTNKIDIFEPTFFAYREDAELAWRMQRLGWNTRYCPRAIAYHVRRVTPERRNELPSEINKLGVQNRFLLQLLHYDFRHYSLHLATAIRNTAVILACLTIEQSSLASFSTIYKNFSQILKKRIWLRRRERVSASSLLPWFSPSRAQIPALSSEAGRDTKIEAVDIIIINFNSGQRLRKCLQLLSSAIQTLEAELKVNVIVFDNNSQDGSATRLVDLFSVLPQFKFVLSPNNLGFAGGINKACEQRSADAFLILNPDVLLDENGLLELVSSLENNSNLAAVAPVLVGVDGEVQKDFSCKQLPTFMDSICELLLLHRLFPKIAWTSSSKFVRHPLIDSYLSSKESKPGYKLTTPLVVEQPPAACFLVRRNAFLELSGFDERFWPAWYEDVDFCKRLSDKGYLCALVNSAKVLHEGGYSVKEIGDVRFRQIWFSNLRRYWKKHGSALESTAVSFLLPLAVLLRALILLPQSKQRSTAVSLLKLAVQLCGGKSPR